MSASSCQQHSGQKQFVCGSNRRVTAREPVNSWVKTLSGVKPCYVFSGKVARGVAEGGSLFPRFQGSIWPVDKKCTGLWPELDLSHKSQKLARSEQRGIVPTLSAAQTLVDLARCSCYSGLQPAHTKCVGTAARSKSSLLWHAGLQLEVAKRMVTTGQRKDMGCSCKTGSWEVGQSRSSPDKWLLRGKLAERRGSLAKGPLSEEVAHKEK